MTARKQQTMTAAQWRKEKGLDAPGSGAVAKPKPAPKPKKPKREGPNDNELRYCYLYLRGNPIHEGRTFTLAERCTYTPDWMAGHPIEFHEVKHDKAMLSGKQEDSRVKFKVASAMNPEFIFVWAKWITKDKAYRREFWKGGRMIKKGEIK